MEMMEGNCVGLNKRKMECGQNDMSISTKRSRPGDECDDFEHDNSASSLDEISCPEVKAEENNTQDCITATLNLFNEAKTNYTELQRQLHNEGGYYSQCEKDVQELHRCELDKEKALLVDYQDFAHGQFMAFEVRLRAKDVEISQKNQELCATEEREIELKERLRVMEISEQELRDKLKSTQHSYTTRLENDTQGQEQYHEYLKLIMKKVKSLRASNETRERKLSEKLNLARNEISELRSSLRSFNQSLDNNSGVSSSGTSIASEVPRLECEEDSLRCVLERQQKHISELIEQNKKLIREAEESTELTDKIPKLKLRTEILTSELKNKSEQEKVFLRQIIDLQKTCNDEKVLRHRLGFQNEMLQNHLRKDSEQLHMLATELHERSPMDSRRPT